MSDAFEYKDEQGNPITSEQAANRYKKAPLSARAREEAEKPQEEELQEGQQSGIIQLDG